MNADMVKIFGYLNEIAGGVDVTNLAAREYPRLILSFRVYAEPRDVPLTPVQKRKLDWIMAISKADALVLFIYPHITTALSAVNIREGGEYIQRKQLVAYEEVLFKKVRSDAPRIYMASVLEHLINEAIQKLE